MATTYTTPFFVSIGDFVKRSDAEKLYNNSKHIIEDVLNVVTPGTTTSVQLSVQAGSNGIVADADDSLLQLCGGTSNTEGAHIVLSGVGRVGSEGEGVFNVGDASLSDGTFSVNVYHSGGGSPATPFQANKSGVLVDDISALGAGTDVYIGEQYLHLNGTSTSTAAIRLDAASGVLTITDPSGSATDDVAIKPPNYAADTNDRAEIESSGDIRLIVTSNYLELNSTALDIGTERIETANGVMAFSTVSGTEDLTLTADDAGSTYEIEATTNLKILATGDITMEIPTSAESAFYPPQNPNNPSSPSAGAVYYNTNQNELRYYNGTSWVTM